MTKTKAGGAAQLWRILRLPAAIFLITTTGLAAALLGDGWWRWLSWALIAVPVIVITAASLSLPARRS